MFLDFPRLLFILTAGVFTLLSPCSYPLLPTYISYYIGSEKTMRKALPSGIACSIGLISFFSLFGIAAMITRSLITPYLPLFTLASGIIIIGLGIATLVKIIIPLPLISIHLSKRKGYFGLFLYGIAYGMSTIGCSAPIFFSIIFSALVAGGHIDAVLTFIIYASGMGIPLIVITYLIAKAKKKILNKIRDSMPLIQKFSGLLLLIIGIYLIIYFYSGNIGTS